VFPAATFEFHPEDYINDPVLLRAVTEQIHTCGTAPRQLFYDPHEPRRVRRQGGYSTLKWDSFRAPTEQEKNSLCFDVRNDRWLKLNSRMPIRILGDSIECLHEQFRFRSEMQPTLIYTSRDDVVTAHALPFILHWTAKPEGLKLVSILTGHFGVVVSVFITVQRLLILAGHCDGRISVFLMCPSRFLRIIECENHAPVSMVRVLLENSDLLACQDTDRGTVMSLFSVNGELLASSVLPHRLRDCLSTSFTTGTRKNVILVLTTDGKLVGLKARTLKYLYTVQLRRTDNAILFIFRNELVFVTDMAMHVTVFAIAPETEPR
jgi:hypothetical protein